MWRDPIVEEVRANRRQLLKENGGNIDALLAQASRLRRASAKAAAPRRATRPAAVVVRTKRVAA